MIVQLEFEIECGEKTCAVEKGKFCRFFRAHFGGKESCYLFGRVFDENGWIQRHPMCLEIGKEVRENGQDT